MRRKGFFLFFVFFTVLLTGCSENNRQPSLEQYSLVTVMGFDYVDKDTFGMSVVIPQVSEAAEQPSQYLDTTASLTQEALLHISSKTDKTVSLKQLRVVMFSEEFAKKSNMRDIITFLYKETEIRSNVRVVIVEGEAKDILNRTYPDKPSTSEYLHDLLEPRMYTFYNPVTTIHHFLHDETDPILEAIAPVIHLEENVLQLKGIGVFDDGYWKLSLNDQESKYIQALRGKVKMTLLKVKLDDEWEEEVILKFITIKTKIRPDEKTNTVRIDVKYKGTLTEYEGSKQKITVEDFPALERQLDKEIKKEIEDLLIKLQENEVDPIGLFEKIRMRQRKEWKLEDTKKHLKDATFDVHVNTTVTSTGTLK
ncbi:Ger(x)C family spore germination protein [Paenisporosarcina cavernae]|uniref:Ger(X)C family spore germination protein n=1 Tax=Paenisporosarcina cavernae TaxID=2320858 RepID=A0A385YQ82_9BACL|nr:Ger(x)C family spore germination protein [Paenisporosarcina cavernae]AYC28621.1 Ger(x)C family spore germination protein [Paenisporosarcina cavernae]